MAGNEGKRWKDREVKLQPSEFVIAVTDDTSPDDDPKPPGMRQLLRLLETEKTEFALDKIRA